jgi:glycosyltransferase involved in cell wall biosynthesis
VVDRLVGWAGIDAYSDGLIAALSERVDVVPTAAPGRLHERLLWRERNLPRLLRDADALLVTSPELPLRPLPVPTVVVVHDVFPLVAAELTGRAKQLRFRMFLPRVCARADRVVCVSEATRAALAEHVAVPPEKLVVIPEGPTPLPLVELPRDPEPLTLYVGELYKRKNLATLLDAYRDPALGRLVLAGPARPGTLAQLQRQIDDWGLSDRVTHAGFVSPHELASLYARATTLVLPSLAEGFGRPLLDALALGTPAVASDIPALRELAGEAALLVDRPRDPAAWRDALGRLIADSALQQRLADAGRDRAAAFTWDRVAADFERLLQTGLTP